MTDTEKKIFETKIDTNIYVPPLPPPPPYQPYDFISISILDPNTIKIGKDIFNITSTMVNKIISQNIMKKVFMLNVSDSIDFETYLKTRILFVENLKQLRDSISEDIYGKKFTDLDYEVQDSLKEIYRFRLVEISQFLDVSFKLLEMLTSTKNVDEVKKYMRFTNK